MARFRELDGLRGIAAMAVVLSHFTGTHNIAYPRDPLPLIDTWWGGYGVQLFFLISGFVILMSAQASARPSDFVISRATRLYPAYWISLALAVSIAWAASVPGVPLDPLVILANLTMVQRWFLVPNVLDVYWTLAVEMQFYVLLFALLITRCRIPDSLMVKVAAAWLLVSLLVSVWAFPFSHGLAPNAVSTPVKLVLNATLAAYGPLFCTGMLAFIGRRRGRMHPLLLPSAATAVLTTGLLQTWIGAIWVTCICTVFIIVSLRQRTWILTIAPVQWLGRISYSLYLTHAIIGYVTIHALWPFIGRQAAVAVAIGASLLVGWGLYELAEKHLSRWARVRLIAWRDRNTEAAHEQ